MEGGHADTAIHNSCWLVIKPSSHRLLLCQQNPQLPELETLRQTGVVSGRFISFGDFTAEWMDCSGWDDVTDLVSTFPSPYAAMTHGSPRHAPRQVILQYSALLKLILQSIPGPGVQVSRCPGVGVYEVVSATTCQ